jgi:hypothetical protein
MAHHFLDVLRVILSSIVVFLVVDPLGDRGEALNPICIRGG